MVHSIIRVLSRLLGGLAVVTSAVVSSGCSNDTQVVVQSVARDSAGVHIVENSSPTWGRGLGVTFASEPELSIGEVEGASPYLLNLVSGALLLSSGEVVVANRGTGELRFFDATGKHLHSLGGVGEGPGEYRDIGSLSRFRGDSLLAFDRSLRRATIVAIDGSFGRVTSIHQVGERGFPSIRFALDDGRMVGQSTVLAASDKPWVLWRDTVLVTSYLPDGSDGKILLRLPGFDRYTVQFDGASSVNNHPLGRYPDIATDGAQIFRTEGSTLSLEVYSDDGTLESIFRGPDSQRSVTSAMIEELKSTWMGDNPTQETRAETERYFQQMEQPEKLPATLRILLDDEGSIWVERYPFLAGVAPSWAVFSANGIFLGDVPFPAHFTPFDIVGDKVVGVHKDELGVERIEIWRLRE